MTTQELEESGFISTPSGAKLYWCRRHAPKTKAVALLLHGFGEHCGRYDAFVGRLAALGISTVRYDHRGHGQSEGRRGHVNAFSEYLDDFDILFEHAFGDAPANIARAVLGHSYGGLIATHALARKKRDIHTLCLSSPFFGFALEVPAIKRFLGSIMTRVAPTFSMPTDIDPNCVSHDPKVVAQYANDPLNGRVASSRWFSETVAAHKGLEYAARSLRCPTLIQQSGADALADPKASRHLFTSFSAPEKKYIEYPDLFHEIWFEQESEKVYADLTAWLKRNLTDGQA